MFDTPRLMMTKLQIMRANIYAQDDVCPEWIAYTSEHELKVSCIEVNAGLFVVALAKFYGANDGNVIFEFDPDGIPTAVIEAILFDRNREPYVADLVAWPLHDPAQFATALGVNGGADVLGVINMVQRGGAPLTVHQTPLDWIKARCQGCVPLNDAGGRHWLNRASGPFVVSGVEEGRWLRDLLGPFGHRHAILIPRSNESSAA